MREYSTSNLNVYGTSYRQAGTYGDPYVRLSESYVRARQPDGESHTANASLRQTTVGETGPNAVPIARASHCSNLRGSSGQLADSYDQFETSAEPYDFHREVAIGRYAPSGEMETFPTHTSRGRDWSEEWARSLPGTAKSHFKSVPCKFHRQGNCQAGIACPFSHSIDPMTYQAPCKFFMKGNCKFGLKCALAHYLPDGRTVNHVQSDGTLDLHETKNFDLSQPLSSGSTTDDTVSQPAHETESEGYRQLREFYHKRESYFKSLVANAFEDHNVRGHDTNSIASALPAAYAMTSTSRLRLDRDGWLPTTMGDSRKVMADMRTVYKDFLYGTDVARFRLRATMRSYLVDGIKFFARTHMAWESRDEGSDEIYDLDEGSGWRILNMKEEAEVMYHKLFPQQERQCLQLVSLP